MGALQQTVDRAVAKGWIPQTDAQTVITKIQSLATKYGFNADDFAIFTHIESFGMNPAAWNGDVRRCAGVIQFCPNNPGDGQTKTIGGTNYNTATIRQMSLVQQLELVDAYLNDVIPRNQRGGITLGNLYFYILYPAIGQKYKSYGDDEDLKGKVGKQAAAFYNPNGTLTKASVLRGLLKQAETNLNSPVTASLGGAQAGPAFGGTGTGTGAAVGASMSVCSDIFPVEFTLEEALYYRGCLSRQIANSIGAGNNLNFPANGQNVGGPVFTIADFDPSGIIPEGAFGFPFKRDVKVTSPFCQRRTKRGRVYYHSGTDYGGRQGEEVLAVADGQVVTPLIGGDGYGPGFLDIVHPKLQNILSRSAHIIPIKRPGDIVKQGEVIGTVGPYPEGGAHLHLELRKDKGAGGSAGSIQECKTKFLDPALFCRRS